MKKFAPDVARAILEYVKNAKTHKRNESVWVLDQERLSKMFLSCPNVSYGFTIKPLDLPGHGPLDFLIETWETRGDEELKDLGSSVHRLQSVTGIPNMIENAVTKTIELAEAVRLMCSAD